MTLAQNSPRPLSHIRHIANSGVDSCHRKRYNTYFLIIHAPYAYFGALACACACALCAACIKSSRRILPLYRRLFYCLAAKICGINICRLCSTYCSFAFTSMPSALIISVTLPSSLCTFMLSSAISILLTFYSSFYHKWPIQLVSRQAI